MCPSEHAAICPSKNELCVLPSMKLELRNKSSPLQLAPKPTHTQRENIKGQYKYRKVASSNMSRLEAHAGFFRLLMK